MLPQILEATTESGVQETVYSVLTFTPAQIKLGILTIIVIGIAIYFIVRPTPEKTKSAEDFLTSLATQIMAIILANIDYRVDGFDGTIELSFDDFKKKIIDMVYDEAWDFVQKAVAKAVEDGKIDGLASKYIKKESVEKLVQVILSRDNIQTKFKSAFDTIIDKFNEQTEKENEEAAKFAEECEKAPLEDGGSVDTSEVEIFANDNEATPDDFNEEDIIEYIE